MPARGDRPRGGGTLYRHPGLGVTAVGWCKTCTL